MSLCCKSEACTFLALWGLMCFYIYYGELVSWVWKSLWCNGYQCTLWRYTWIQIQSLPFIDSFSSYKVGIITAPPPHPPQGLLGLNEWCVYLHMYVCIYMWCVCMHAWNSAWEVVSSLMLAIVQPHQFRSLFMFVSLVDFNTSGPNSLSP